MRDSRINTGRIQFAAAAVAVLLFLAGGPTLFAANTPQPASSAPDGDLDLDAPAAPHRAGPQARAARLTSVVGHVQLFQDGKLIADPALNNSPMLEGGQVATGIDGQAEVQLEDGSVVRLSPNTALSFAVLRRDGQGTRTEIVLYDGLAYFELEQATTENRIKVSFGDASFAPASFAVVRLNDDTPPGALAVFEGAVHVQRGTNIQTDVRNGETLAFDPADANRFNIIGTIKPDSWDAWNADRDEVLSAQMDRRTAASRDYANGNSGPGAQGAWMGDLDANGDWYDVPGEGYVWSPYEAEGAGSAWDPYGYGNWVDYPGYGYEFVSAYDWGYAPFQCGTWNFYDGFGWGWQAGSGCNSWWGGYEGFGGGGWYGNVGRGPGGYRPIHPPDPRRKPSRLPGSAGARQTAGVIPVDRRPPNPGGQRPAGSQPGAGSLAGNRPGNAAHPVVIAGHTVEPMRPLQARRTYDGAAGESGASGMMTQGQAGSANSSQNYGDYSGRSPRYPGNRNATAPSGSGLVPYPGAHPAGSSGYTPRPSGSGYTPSHSAPPPAYHPPAGGGGGGGGHSSPPPPPPPAPHPSSPHR